MIRRLSKLWFRFRMARFPKAPKHPRSSDGRYMPRKQWRIEQMRRQG